MRKLAIWFLALGLIAAPAAFAFSSTDDNKTGSSDNAKSADSTKPAAGDAAKTDTKAATSSSTPSSAELASEIEALRALILKQAEQLDKQQQELVEMQNKLAGQSAPTGTPAANGQVAYSPSGNSVAPAGNSANPVPGNAGSAPVGTSSSAANSPAGAPAPKPQGGEQHSPLFLRSATRASPPSDSWTLRPFTARKAPALALGQRLAASLMSTL